MSYDSLDRSCRYLNCCLFQHTPDSSTETIKDDWGCFGQYIYLRLDWKTLPYRISMSELLTSGSLIPDVFLCFPEEEFLQWENFPCEPFQGKPPKNLLSVLRNKDVTTSYSDLVHPFDRLSKPEELERFSCSTIPEVLSPVYHPMANTFFYPYEAYFSYWKMYVLVDALYRLYNIEELLPADSGKDKIKSRLKEVSSQWDVKYSNAFNDLAIYKRSWDFLIREKKIEEKEISNLLLEKAKITVDRLEDNMYVLLELFGCWRDAVISSSIGKVHYGRAIKHLRSDIYYLLRWLCGATGKTEDYYFDKYEHEKNSCFHCKLSSAIEYENFDLKGRFTSFFLSYLDKDYRDKLELDPKELYDFLIDHCDGFQVWVRAFYDLQDQRKAPSYTDPLILSQPRIVDHLSVITSKTEPILKYLLETLGSKPSSIKGVFSELKKLDSCSPTPLKEEHHYIVNRVITEWRKVSYIDFGNTDFDNMFNCISNLNFSNKSNKFKRIAVLNLLKFVVVRHYFSHSGKHDGKLNFVGENSVNVLKYSIYTIVFVYIALKDAGLLTTK